MGSLSLMSGIATRILRGATATAGHVVHQAIQPPKGIRAPKLGIPKPPVWHVKQRLVYRVIKSSNHPGIQAMQVKGNYDMASAIKEIPHKEHLSAWWLEKAIRYVQTKDGVSIVMAYLKGPGAANLTTSQKAELWGMCIQKIQALEWLKEFL